MLDFLMFSVLHLFLIHGLGLHLVVLNELALPVAVFNNHIRGRLLYQRLLNSALSHELGGLLRNILDNSNSTIYCSTISWGTYSIRVSFLY